MTGHQHAPAGEAARRPTKQQAAVATALGHVEDFVSAQQLHARMRAGGNPIGLATVYRALTALAADGVLDGAEIEYELVAVTPVEGPACDGVWCTTDPETGVVSIEAMSGGATRADRSLHVGFDGHPHGQLLGVTQEGEYDLTLVAWDANGVFLDSDPVIVRVHAHVPTPDFNGDGMVDGADLGFLLGSWGTHEADLDGDGMTDGADLGILLGAWG